ncbi:DgyrCDS7422 [Dimorphilus gyrociliatus]|uniref:DgyrCDS7422 n=1 Tax=Dimorphilus gyrociliatus TaxID=2664684 RepID=A0A7I8VVY4_9ANNE|nr:DgyrCDS7422 [Dimorphilus gyrociliatus]
MRSQLSSIGADLSGLKKSFYESKENSEASFVSYLRNTNAHLLRCIKISGQKNNVVIDSEISLVTLTNTLKEKGSDYSEDGKFLSEWWRHLQSSLVQIDTLKRRFTNVHARLKSNCLCSAGIDAPPVTKSYAMASAKYAREIENILRKMDRLTSSWMGTGLSSVRADTFSTSHFCDRVVNFCCDAKILPVLRLFPDLTEKLEKGLECAKAWINKDEDYVREINSHLLDARRKTIKKQRDLAIHKNKKEELKNSVEGAYNVCQTHRKEVERIQKELVEVEQMFNFCKRTLQSKAAEIRHKQGMLDILQLSLSQTSRTSTFSIQSKRNRLKRQLRGLGVTLQNLHEESQGMQKRIDKISIKELEMTTAANDYHQTYLRLKENLDKFEMTVLRLVTEIEELTSAVNSLQDVHTIKTNSETVDDFLAERPLSIKLAPSLQQKIEQRRLSKY